MINLDQIAERIEAVPLSEGRRIIAIAGAPASGKSSLAEKLRDRIAQSTILAMDGFHRDNEDLAAHGLLERKGAPETFDAQGFAALVTRLRSEPALSVPTFDRAADRVVPGGARIAPTDHTILVEGNYLLLDRPVWQDLAQVWDFSIFLDVPIEELKRRLIARWIGHGHSEQEALERAMGNDIPNAELVVQNARPADLVVG